MQHTLRRHLKSFLAVAVLVSLAHCLLVSGLYYLTFSAPEPLSTLLNGVLWCLTAPISFLLSSSSGRTLSIAPLTFFFATNSVLWGLAISGVVVWRKIKCE